MNTETGQIRREEKLTPKQRGVFLPIPKAHVTEVTGMNRAQRRAWAKEHKTELKARVEKSMAELRGRVSRRQKELDSEKAPA